MSDGVKIVDVDGLYLYKKQQRLISSGIDVAPLKPPPPPLSGWESVTEASFKTLATSIPRVTPGTLLQYKKTCAMN